MFLTKFEFYADIFYLAKIQYERISYNINITTDLLQKVWVQSTETFVYIRSL